MRVYDSLQHPQVRDLAWACFSPPLLEVVRLEPAAGSAGLTEADLPLTDTRRDWLLALDHSPQPLERWLARQPARRLGIYFEQLWQFFLREDADTELLACNLPLRTAGHTIGEFDCLYYCRRRQRHFHLELAVKFYLGYRQEWLGPNTVDRLDRKLARLLQHQCRLSLHPAAGDILAHHGIADCGREIALRGSLFRPATQDLPPPTAFHRDQRLLCWYTLEQWRQLAEPAARYVVLSRLHWLAPLRCWKVPSPPVDVAAQLAAHFDGGGRPLMLARVDQRGDECERFFVAGEEWPLVSYNPPVKAPWIQRRGP